MRIVEISSASPSLLIFDPSTETKWNKTNVLHDIRRDASVLKATYHEKRVPRS